MGCVFTPTVLCSRHVDVANQRVKVTLFQMLRRRAYLTFWQLRDRFSATDSEQAPLAGQPKWARQLALAGTPAAQAVLDGLTNPVTGETLPIEVRDRFLVSRQEEEICASPSRSAHPHSLADSLLAIVVWPSHPGALAHQSVRLHDNLAACRR